MFKKKESRTCDFGQYDQLWGAHRDSCKRIIRITGKYIVYIDKQNNIDWETTEDYDASRTDEGRRENEKVLSQCLIAEHKPTAGLSDSVVLSFKIIIGEAIVNCLESNCEGSLEILKQADEFRLDRVVEKSRGWYLSYSVFISGLLIIAVLTVMSCTECLSEETLWHIRIGAWAVAGACLSIILRSGRLQHASYAGRQLHFIESGCRILGGFISGQIVYLGIKSGVLFSSLVSADNASYVISFLALLAGASERFAPSIITKVEEAPSFQESAKDK
jgi:hypothetical protein